MNEFATKQDLVTLMQSISQKISVPTIGIGGGYAPIGTVISVMGTTAPQDYLACDGTAYNISDYPQLADYFETQFGSKNFFGGNGTTTFAVPDLRGEFLRGTGTNSHANQGSGANVGVHQDGTEHVNFSGSKSLDVSWGIHYNSTYNGQDIVTHSKADKDIDPKNVVAWCADLAAAGAGWAENVPTKNVFYTSRPTNTSVLYCIKAVVAGEVYSTEERVVGTWIDGKKIWQKTVVTISPNTSSNGDFAYKTISHGITNIDKIVMSFGNVVTNTISLNMPAFVDLGYKIKFNASKTEIVIANDATTWNDSDVYITLRYTKTTD